MQCIFLKLTNKLLNLNKLLFKLLLLLITIMNLKIIIKFTNNNLKNKKKQIKSSSTK